MSRRLAALTALVALAALALSGATASAQTLTDETLLSNDPDTSSTSSGNCGGRAQGFTTGPAAATLSEVRVRANNSGIDVEIREDSSGNPSTTVLYQMSGGTLTSGVVTVSAPANARLSANTDYWLVIAVGSPGSCSLEQRTLSTLHGWSAGGTKWWNNQWLDDTTNFFFDIVGAVHGGTPHEPVPEEPEADDSYQSDYEPLPRCTEEQRQWRQRGRELPPACRGGFYHPFQMYPNSDPLRPALAGAGLLPPRPGLPESLLGRESAAR